MFSESAELYDAIYSKVKNYEEEAHKVRSWIKKLHPEARTLLDVACGTGEHARFLKEQYRIDGLDLSPEFVRIAGRKNPAGTYRVADMTAFDMGKTYDVIVCLFSSIGYVVSKEKLHAAIACFANHLNPNGLMLIEPWFTPEQWNPGRPHMITVDEAQLKVCRMNISETRDRKSFFRFHYLVGTPEKVIHFTEDHTLGLFTTPQMKEAFAAADLAVEFDEQGIFGRGLYTAKRTKDLGP